MLVPSPPLGHVSLSPLAVQSASPAVAVPSAAPAAVAVPSTEPARAPGPAVAPAAPAPARLPHPRDWTLPEIIDRCPTWKEFEFHKPVGFGKLKETWEHVDGKVRRRHHKKPKAKPSALYQHVHAYIKNYLHSYSKAYSESRLL